MRRASDAEELTATTDTLEAVAGRRGSLVFSELEADSPQVPNGGFSSYWFGHYVEVYNNADTTIYLDGKVIVLGMIFGTRDYNETFNCETMAKWQLDPEGIWTSRFVEAFPGSGRQYPLQPGQAAVVATDAIDHTGIDSRLPDLSHADFEFIGSADVDNPAVPNMVTLGPTPEEEPLFGVKHCPMWTAPNLDQQPASLFDFDVVNAFRRREPGVLPDGRVVLQRTKNSAQDFRGAPLTLGKVP